MSQVQSPLESVEPLVKQCFTPITLEEYCSRGPDWDLLARELVMVFMNPRKLVAKYPVYRFALLMGLPQLHHILMPRLDPPPGIPARYAFWVIDARAVRPLNQRDFLPRYPRLKPAIEEAMRQFNYPAKASKMQMKTKLKFVYPKPNESYQWFLEEA
jgi:hypothetical protein